MMSDDFFSSLSTAPSLLSARRPSWSPSLPPELDRENENPTPQDISESNPLQSNARSSLPYDGGTFSQSLQIDMSSLVGNAVGSVRG